MKELTEKHVKFLKKKLIPMLSEMSNDTITFDEMEYTQEEMIEWIEQIIDKGEYNENEQRFLTGMGKLYEHLND